MHTLIFFAFVTFVSLRRLLATESPHVKKWYGVRFASPAETASFV